MRGRRAKQADEEVQTEGDAVEVIDVSAHEPRRIPSKKWRELIKKVWEATRCDARSAHGKCASLRSSTRRMSSSASCAISGSGPTGNDPRSVARRTLPRRTGHGVLRHLKRPAAPKCDSRTPCSAATNSPAPVFDFRAHFCHCIYIETHAFGFRPPADAQEGQKRFPINRNSV